MFIFARLVHKEDWIELTGLETNEIQTASVATRDSEKPNILSNTQPQFD